METKHTPGPWKVEEYNSATLRGAIGIFSADSTIPIVHSPMGESLAEADANARLIAAAPELLAAAEKASALIKHLIKVCQNNGLTGDSAEDVQCDWLQHINAAIAKATGGGQ